MQPGGACDWLWARSSLRRLRTGMARVLFCSVGGLGAAACLLALIHAPRALAAPWVPTGGVLT